MPVGFVLKFDEAIDPNGAAAAAELQAPTRPRSHSAEKVGSSALLDDVIPLQQGIEINQGRHQ
jgi:hypothetical protein